MNKYISKYFKNQFNHILIELSDVDLLDNFINELNDHKKFMIKK
jgi:hypothetical protein